MSHDLMPVINSPETAEEDGGVMENSSVLSPSTERISESPVKENLAPAATTTMVDNGLSSQVKSRWSFSSSKISFGSSKDETFFDSHQWLQTDSEDDFYSVHGDFTPSVGNTPKCSFSEKLPRFHNPLFVEEKPRVSFSHPLAAPRRKKLGELFRDSIREGREKILEESSESEKSKKSSTDNSGELKITEDSSKEKKNLKSLNSHHRCLPRISSFKGSLMEKRKKKKKKIHVK